MKQEGLGGLNRYTCDNCGRWSDSRESPALWWEWQPDMNIMACYGHLCGDCDSREKRLKLLSRLAQQLRRHGHVVEPLRAGWDT